MTLHFVFQIPASSCFAFAPTFITYLIGIRALVPMTFPACFITIPFAYAYAAFVAVEIFFTIAYILNAVIGVLSPADWRRPFRGPWKGVLFAGWLTTWPSGNCCSARFLSRQVSFWSLYYFVFFSQSRKKRTWIHSMSKIRTCCKTHMAVYLYIFDLLSVCRTDWRSFFIYFMFFDQLNCRLFKMLVAPFEGKVIKKITDSLRTI